MLVMTPGPPTFSDLDDPLECFLNMEDQTFEVETSSSPADPVLPCKTPSLELQLELENDEQLSAAKFMKYTVTAAGYNLSGALDEKGYVKLDGIDVPADQMELIIEIEDPESEEEDIDHRGYTLHVVPPGKKAEAEEYSDDLIDPPFQFVPIYERDIAIEMSGDDDEDF